jgi:uncharacterized protein (UPF0332 family)
MYTAEQWENQARQSLEAAQLLFNEEYYRDCVSRAYYAAYQAAAAASVEHGDSRNFPVGWNNPSHEQLPDLIANNGDLSQATRKEVRRLLRILRSSREDADYRPGRTVDRITAYQCLSGAIVILKHLGSEE